MVSFALKLNAFENARAIHSNCSATSWSNLKSEDLFVVKSELILTMSVGL